MSSAGYMAIMEERSRQELVKGYSADLDDTYKRGELLRAANCYWHADETPENMPAEWPWDSLSWKPSKDRRRNLEKAGALFMAEADRLNRANAEYAEIEAVLYKVDEIAKELTDSAV